MSGILSSLEPLHFGSVQWQEVYWNYYNVWIDKTKLLILFYNFDIILSNFRLDSKPIKGLQTCISMASLQDFATYML